MSTFVVLTEQVLKEILPEGWKVPASFETVGRQKISLFSSPAKFRDGGSVRVNILPKGIKRAVDCANFVSESLAYRYLKIRSTHEGMPRFIRKTALRKIPKRTTYRNVRHICFLFVAETINENISFSYRKKINVTKFFGIAF